MVIAIESITTFTPLGIRCWDPVFDRQVDDGLTVTARPFIAPNKTVNALRTPGGVYVFPHLPGMREIENEYNDSNDYASPAPGYRFVIEINDSRKRYVSIAFYVDLPLPYPGIFLTNDISSPGLELPKGLHLYSSVTRKISSNMAIIRGELLQQVSRQPAAHALLMLLTESGESWYGISDEKGLFTIVFPYPELQEGFAASPFDNSSGAISEQNWALQLSVFYSPVNQQLLPGTDIPNYLSILHQRVAEIWLQNPDQGGVPIGKVPVTLVYQQLAVIKTEGLPQLLISPLP